MRLNETEMVKLLPAWMQEDGSDKGLATGCDIISRDAYARLKLLSRWDKIDQLSDAELDEMAQVEVARPAEFTFFWLVCI